MASAVINRSVVRKAIAALFTGLTTGGTPLVKVVYDYQIGDLQGQSPVIVVVSGPASHEKISERGLTETHHIIYVHLFVLYATEDGLWTEAASEDKIDAVEKAVTDLVIDNFAATAWFTLSLGEFSEVTAISMANVLYRHESISVDVLTYGK